MTQKGSLRLLTGTSSTSGHTIFRYPQMTSAYIYQLRWLPSNNIAFTLNWSQLALAKSDGSHLQPIPDANKQETRKTRQLLSWSVSPDNKRIALSLAPRYGEQTGSLCIYNISNKQLMEISNEYRPLDIAWSPDGRGIWFVNSRPGGGAPGMSFNPYPPNRLHWISIDGKKHRVLPKENNGIRNIRCAKDGTVFYISDGQLHTAR